MSKRCIAIIDLHEGEDHTDILNIAGLLKEMQKKIKNDLVYILVSFPLPIHPEILSLFDEQIPKKFIKEKSSIFTIVELQAYLNSNKITDILYVGRHINDCIKNSMIDGKQLGFNGFFYPELVSDFADEGDRMNHSGYDKLREDYISELSKYGHRINAFDELIKIISTQ